MNIEDCTKLSVGKIPTEAISQSKTTWKSGEDNRVFGTYGELFIESNGSVQKIYYVARLMKQEASITIFYNLFGEEKVQIIPIDYIENNFGHRPYFRCPKCKNRCNNLYIPPQKNSVFSCRNCLNLSYELTRINRDSCMGEILYRLHHALKLIEMKNDIKRLFYDGEMTKKAKRYIKAVDKWCMSPEEIKELNQKVEQYA